MAAVCFEEIRRACFWKRPNLKWVIWQTNKEIRVIRLIRDQKKPAIAGRLPRAGRETKPPGRGIVTSVSHHREAQLKKEGFMQGISTAQVI
jgi:hypothetical protein